MTAASNDTEASPSDFTADLNTPHDDAPPHYYYALLDDNDHRSPPPHHHTMNNHRHQPTRSAPPHNGGSGLFSPLLVEGGGGDFSASLLTDTDDKNHHNHHIDNLLGNNPATETLLLDCSERQLFLQDDDDDHDRRNHPRPDSSFHGEHMEDSYTSSPNNQNGTSRRPLYYSSRRRAPLNGLNYLNVVTFALHLFVSWGIGVWGLRGHIPTRWEIANRYETLVAPTAWTLWIWYPILVLEGVFTVAQLLPYYRARPIVQAGTSYYFFYTFVASTAWTLFYSFQFFILSFVSVLVALLSLVRLLASQQASLVGVSTSSGGRRLGSRLTEYYLFRFPFYLHAGWMACLASQHFSLLFRSYQAGTSLQVAIDVVSLAWLLPTALVFLACPHFKDFVIPLVVVWSYVRSHT